MYQGVGKRLRRIRNYFWKVFWRKDSGKNRLLRRKITAVNGQAEGARNVRSDTGTGCI
jgi:hypothetical protein